MRTILILLIATSTTFACSFCGDGLLRRQSLRQQYADAKAVFHGTLKNPKPGDDGVHGTTEFHIASTLKNTTKLTAPAVLIIPRYIPVLANTPGETLYFCGERDGTFDAITGVPLPAAQVAYLKAAIDAKGALAHFFTHLEHTDATVATDAFLEFAKASDTALQESRGTYDRVKLRAWLENPKTPEERLGVYALLLGLCGNASDAAWFVEELRAPSDRVRGNLGGLLAGLTLLDEKLGWDRIRSTLAGDANIADKLNVLGTLRYFQATRPKESRATLVEIYQTLLANPDLCDLAIDDLRRWAWWDLTTAVLRQYETATSPLMKRQVLRYALTCNDDACKTLAAKVRTEDPKLIAKVEASLK